MSQTMHSGPGSSKNIVRALNEKKCARILVVHGRTSFIESGAKNILAGLHDFEFIHFDDVKANPETESVIRCTELFTRTQPDTILAIGGGSVIDTAKGTIAYMSGTPESEILANNFDPGAAKPLFIAIPTTAGSGSEATPFAVLYKNGIKHSIAHQLLLPEIVFLDPELTLSCSRQLTLASGLDAVCQSIESLWSKGATAQSREYAEEALALLLPNIFNIINSPSNLVLRTPMLMGANLAGKAIAISRTTAAHALSYGLTSRYDIPHGIAVLLVMGPLVALMSEKYHLFQDTNGFKPLTKIFGGNFLEGFRQFFTNSLHLLGTLKVPSITPAEYKQEIEYLCNTVNIERLSTHPITLTNADIFLIYTEILTQLGIIKKITKELPNFLVKKAD